MGIRDVLINALYPARCPLCEKILSSTRGKRQLVCKTCMEKLPLIISPRCMKCGKQLDKMERELCQDCEKKDHVFERGVAAAAYSDELRASMHRYKYKARREYTEFYAKLMEMQCGDLIRRWKVDVILPVPMYRYKERVRGYNQAALLAQALGERMNIPVDSTLLVRTRNTKPMKELDDRERLKNIQNAFKIRQSVIRYNHILLVDDIYTTGSTIDACAVCLKQAGAQKVYYASLCIGNGF